ncbi:hypothetical protein E2C01_001346 [Portunus trituberculatus]|uniref:Uncharacterized protein n=1 Tax=Portunus trituberculatus TaxID=210409 RepID=A0A5B7CGG7_PORTR|nr:hypothetical protein [Portunus trituberculatus]
MERLEVKFGPGKVLSLACPVHLCFLTVQYLASRIRTSITVTLFIFQSPIAHIAVPLLSPSFTAALRAYLLFLPAFQPHPTSLPSSSRGLNPDSP